MDVANRVIGVRIVEVCLALDGLEVLRGKGADAESLHEVSDVLAMVKSVDVPKLGQVLPLDHSYSACATRMRGHEVCHVVHPAIPCKPYTAIMICSELFEGNQSELFRRYCMSMLWNMSSSITQC
jgi:hypothetical protein